jgi:hypothetical protein
VQPPVRHRTSRWNSHSRRLAGTAARRRRVLAHLSPIFDLHLNRARNPSEVVWSAYDFIALIQLTVDVVALSSGLDVLSEQPGRGLDRLIKVLRMAIDDLWVDSRHDVLTPRSGAVP